MKSNFQTGCPDVIEFYFPDLDNHVQVENLAGSTVIRATRDNFSAKRKASFIRHLAAEGQIPEQYAWFFEAGSGEFLGLKWMIDRSWARLDPEVRRRAQRKVFWVILWSSVLWLLLMLILFFLVR